MYLTPIGRRLHLCLNNVLFLSYWSGKMSKISDHPSNQTAVACNFKQLLDWLDVSSSSHRIDSLSSVYRILHLNYLFYLLPNLGIWIWPVEFEELKCYIWFEFFNGKKKNGDYDFVNFEKQKWKSATEILKRWIRRQNIHVHNTI